MRIARTGKYLLILAILLGSGAKAQTTVVGSVKSDKAGEPLGFGSVQLIGSTIGTATDENGRFILHIPAGGENGKLVATYPGYIPDTISLIAGRRTYEFVLKEEGKNLSEVVVSGTMKEVSRMDSPVPVEVYTAKYFLANPTPSVFDALQNVNGVRPQLNCNICSTGDIHINGLEGPYTMILIDGMPIVSGLSTVYGLSGIPQSLIERVEIVKGPASALYGSEAVGGLINVITKKPDNAPLFSADIFGTSWGELNADVAAKINAGSRLSSLVGVNYFNYQVPIDNNGDGFTDVTLQNRVSVFNKWRLARKDSRLFSLAGRYVYEDRWGGQMNWAKEFRGGDSIYGESIYTKRWELFGIYDLPTKENIRLMFSANGHDQNSVYGNIPFEARQYIGFGQLSWTKTVGANDFLVGAAFRYTWYDDNTLVTEISDSGNAVKNMPSRTYLPGLFVQDEIRINRKNIVLLGMRYDHNSIHGSILSPRLNYKWNSNDKSHVVRFSVGNGYRVANVFTEDHAALTGSRKVEFLEDLKPETSWNANLNYVKKVYTRKGAVIGFDATAFYTHFSNKIIPDYDSDPNKIIYDNLDGYAVSSGISLNMDIALNNGLKFLLGGTYMDVYSVEDQVRTQQMFTERFTGVWNIGYNIRSLGLSIDYTGNVYSPMRLPLLSELDPRREYSPWWSIQNIQLTKRVGKSVEIYGGVKNLLNWTPNKGNPFIIARAEDPFDKNVEFDPSGQALSTASNPFALTFDPAYVYGPNQGRRIFLGLRLNLNGKGRAGIREIK